MIKNFNEEFGLIYDNNQIKEKLLTLKVYNIFYDCIMEALPADDSNVIQYYESIIKDTFKMTVKMLSLDNKMNLDAKQFMQLYVWLFKFKCMDTQNKDDKYGIYGIICSFNNSFFDGSPLFDDEIIKAVNKFESISLAAKVNIMIRFYEYSRYVYHGLKLVFNEEVSSTLDSNISSMLLTKLEDYLKDALNKGIDLNESTTGLKTSMRTATKDYLMNILNNGGFGVDSHREDTWNKIFSSFNELERKFWSTFEIYCIIGDGENDSLENALKELNKDLTNSEDFINFYKNLFKKIKNVISTPVDDDTPVRR